MVEHFGELNIKQGWMRAILFYVFYILIAGGLSWLLQRTLSGKGEDAGKQQMALVLTYFLLAVITFGVVWLFRRFVDKRSLYSLGFAWKGSGDYVATGGLAAMAMLGIGTLLLLLTGHLTFTEVNSNLKHLFFNLLLMLMVALVEEVVFRGYLLNNLLQSFNKWLALGMSTVLFIIIHLGNDGIGLLPMLEIGIGGAMLGINYIFTRNLWFGIALHFAWNFLQGPVLGYKVSGLDLPSLLKQEVTGPTWLTGGAFGFEGSIVAMILNVVLIVMLALLYTRQQKIELPQISS